MTYLELINKCKTYQDKEIDAFLYLITEITGLSRSSLYLKYNDVIEEDLLIKLEDAITKYAINNIPVQYIIGYTYFFGLKIFVSPSVLIPRFETEEVVYEATKLFPKETKINIVDVCTGSGCIALALKQHYQNSVVKGIDISKDALKIALQNANYHNLEVEFLENDLLDNVNEKFDLIISNPPYIAYGEEVMPLVYDNEPHLALFSDEGGLYHYRRIIESSKKLLNPGGYIVLEIAYNRRKEMESLVSQYFKNFEIKKDNYNNDRIMIIKGD